MDRNTRRKRKMVKPSTSLGVGSTSSSLQKIKIDVPRRKPNSNQQTCSDCAPHKPICIVYIEKDEWNSRK
jgi:hypothetical protein